jgi:hypothetical protein
MLGVLIIKFVLAIDDVERCVEKYLRRGYEPVGGLTSFLARGNVYKFAAAVWKK